MPLFNADELRDELASGTQGPGRKENAFHFTLDNTNREQMIALVPKAKQDDFLVLFTKGQPTLSMSATDEDGDEILFGKEKVRQTDFRNWQLYDRDPTVDGAKTLLREAENRNPNKRRSGYIGILPQSFFRVVCLAFRKTLGIVEAKDANIPDGKGQSVPAGDREITPS